MADLKTKYMGLELKNPLIMGSTNLSGSIEFVKKLEKNGIAAIVYKTIFEKDVQLENLELHEEMESYTERHAQMITQFPEMDDFGPEERLNNMKKLKESVNIPVIASLNAVNKSSWIEYAKKIEATGVDALELNLYYEDIDFNKEADDIEKEQLEIVKEVRKSIKIPVSVKLSPFYSNCLNMIKKLEMAGVNGFVLFNKFLEPDISIKEEELQIKHNFSKSNESRHPLRYIGMCYGNIGEDICASTGILSSTDVIKMILAGAPAVQLASFVYKNGFDAIGDMLKEIEEWMDKRGYRTIEEFKGELAMKNLKDPTIYKKVQYFDVMKKLSDLISGYALK